MPSPRVYRGGAPLPGEPDPGPDLKLLGALIQERDGAADGAAATHQDGKHAGEARLQAHIPGQRLAHIHQGAELSCLARFGARRS